MSAYALPGLFPPLKSSSQQNSEGNSTEGTPQQNPLHVTLGESALASPSAFLAPGSIAIPSNLLSSAFPSFVNFGSSNTSRSSSSSSIHDMSRTDEPGIAIKEAKIDPVRLLQSAKGLSRTQQQQRKGFRRRGSRERLGEVSQASPSGPKDKASLQNESQSNGQSPHDEAIEFELSISFNGRKYTATRTLQRIFQLRDDLIHEMETRRRWLQFHKAGTSASTSIPAEESQHPGLDQEMCITIPEIPPMTGEDSSSGPFVGFVGRGFTLLHAMATSYVPVMEGWLRNVMAIVPQDSECLTDFLWEPLSNGENNAAELGSKSCTSLANLGAIKEGDYNTSDSDDEADTW